MIQLFESMNFILSCMAYECLLRSTAWQLYRIESVDFAFVRIFRFEYY